MLGVINNENDRHVHTKKDDKKIKKIKSIKYAQCKLMGNWSMLYFNR